MSPHPSIYAGEVSALERSSAAYYGSDPDSVELTDAQFDKKLAWVREYELEHDLVPALVTSSVGGKTGTLEHDVPMLSLGNVFSYEDAQDWARKVCESLGNDHVRFSIEPKNDGCAISIDYAQGKPVRMITRGDGLHGENITDALDQVVLPIITDPYYQHKLTVRGEITFNHGQFIDANIARQALGKPLFKNTRNAVAGVLGTEKKHRTLNNISMTFHAYDGFLNTPGNKDPDGNELFDSMMINSELLRLGFNTTISEGTQYAKFGRVAPMVKFIESKCFGTEDNWSLNYDTDGVVIKVQEFALRDSLGQNSRIPKWAIAYKFPANTVTSTVPA